MILGDPNLSCDYELEEAAGRKGETKINGMEKQWPTNTKEPTQGKKTCRLLDGVKKFLLRK